ncbi:hypothetical protein NEFER01_0535 [Nematocida sp. LUAm1]|nr:hypothetical protein NEFER02_0463 [Nematocida sp. LUAm2]KAI5177260.1 hypothetical protein NEFER01_0535 [Nematocida sp. LUAm1]
MKNGVLAAYFNLLKTIVGGGVVSFPLLFTVFGIVPTFLFSFLIAILTIFELSILCEAAKYSEKPEKTFTESLKGIYPRISGVFNIIVFVKCLGVSISYLITVKPLIVYLTKEIFKTDISGATAVLFFGVFMFFICSMKDLKNLQFTSFLGLMGIIFCICGSIYNMVNLHGTEAGNITYARSPSTAWIIASGQFVFSFTCHQNIFSVRSEIVNPTRKVLTGVILSSVFTGLCLYLTFGTITYLTYGDNVKSNVFETLDDGWFKIGITFFYTIILIFSYPLQIFPSRECLFQWTISIFNISDEKKNLRNIIRVSSAFILIAVGVLVAFSSIDIAFLQSFVGSTASMVMCIIIPLMCFFKIPRKKHIWEFMFSALLMGVAALCLLGVLFMFKKQSIEK